MKHEYRTNFKKKLNLTEWKKSSKIFIKNFFQSDSWTVLNFQVPTDAEKFLMDRELKNKYDTVWRDRLTNLMEDLEAAKLTIHNLTQENMNLHITIQKQSEETQRMSDEAKMMLEAQIDRLKSENERLANTQRPQIKALETEVASMTKTNVKLRHFFY